MFLQTTNMQMQQQKVSQLLLFGIIFVSMRSDIFVAGHSTRIEKYGTVSPFTILFKTDHLASFFFAEHSWLVIYRNISASEL